MGPKKKECVTKEKPAKKLKPNPPQIIRIKVSSNPQFKLPQETTEMPEIFKKPKIPKKKRKKSDDNPNASPKKRGRPPKVTTNIQINDPSMDIIGCNISNFEAFIPAITIRKVQNKTGDKKNSKTDYVIDNHPKKQPDISETDFDNLFKEVTITKVAKKRPKPVDENNDLSDIFKPPKKKHAKKIVEPKPVEPEPFVEPKSVDTKPLEIKTVKPKPKPKPKSKRSKDQLNNQKDKPLPPDKQLEKALLELDNFNAKNHAPEKTGNDWASKTSNSDETCITILSKYGCIPIDGKLPSVVVTDITKSNENLSGLKIIEKITDFESPLSSHLHDLSLSSESSSSRCSSPSILISNIEKSYKDMCSKISDEGYKKITNILNWIDFDGLFGLKAAIQKAKRKEIEKKILTKNIPSKTFDNIKVSVNVGNEGIRKIINPNKQIKNNFKIPLKPVDKPKLMDITDRQKLIDINHRPTETQVSPIFCQIRMPLNITNQTNIPYTNQITLNRHIPSKQLDPMNLFNTNQKSLNRHLQSDQPYQIHVPYVNQIHVPYANQIPSNKHLLANQIQNFQTDNFFANPKGHQKFDSQICESRIEPNNSLKRHVNDNVTPVRANQMTLNGPNYISPDGYQITSKNNLGYNNMVHNGLSHGNYEPSMIADLNTVKLPLNRYNMVSNSNQFNVTPKTQNMMPTLGDEGNEQPTQTIRTVNVTNNAASNISIESTTMSQPMVGFPSQECIDRGSRSEPSANCSPVSMNLTMESSSDNQKSIENSISEDNTKLVEKNMEKDLMDELETDTNQTKAIENLRPGIASMDIDDDDALSLYATDSLDGFELANDTTAKADKVVLKIGTESTSIPSERFPNMIKEHSKIQFPNDTKLLTSEVNADYLFAKLSIPLKYIKHSFIFSGTCFQKLDGNCKGNKCRFLHRDITEDYVYEKLRPMNDNNFINEYLMIKKFHVLFKRFIKVFLLDAVRRDISPKILLKFILDCLVRGTKGLRDTFECVFIKISETNLNDCQQILKSSVDCRTFCACLLEMITESRNFLQFKTFFYNLTVFSVNFNVALDIKTTTSILQRVPVEMYDFDLLTAVFNVIKCSNIEIFDTISMKHFQNTLTGKHGKFYQELQVLKSVAKGINTKNGTANQQQRNRRKAPSSFWDSEDPRYGGEEVESMKSYEIIEHQQPNQNQTEDFTNHNFLFEINQTPDFVQFAPQTNIQQSIPPLLKNINERNFANNRYCNRKFGRNIKFRWD